MSDPTVRITSLVSLRNDHYRFIALYDETEVRDCCARYDGAHVSIVWPPFAWTVDPAGERRHRPLVIWSPSLRERIRVAVEIAIAEYLGCRGSAVIGRSAENAFGKLCCASPR